jgi:electron transport complex protein RnfE
MSDIPLDAPVKQRSIIIEFTKGFVKENPTFVQVLGMCPTLAVTTTVGNGIGMGLATLFVLTLSALVASAVKRIVPAEVRIPVYTVIIATFVTLADLFMQAYDPPLSKALGPYVPLIVVNCIIMGRVEAFATKNPVVPTLADAVGMGAGFTVSLMVLGAVRELLGHGTLLGANILGSGFRPMLVMVLPPGAFLTLGILMAVFNAVRNRRELVVVGG